MKNRLPGILIDDADRSARWYAVYGAFFVTCINARAQSGNAFKDEDLEKFIKTAEEVADLQDAFRVKQAEQIINNIKSELYCQALG